MTRPNDRFANAKRNLAEMQALIGVLTPKPKVESGIRRGQKHSGRTLPVPEDDHPRPTKRRSAKAE